MSDDLDSRFRLGRHAVPEAYRLRLEPHLDAATFDGAVEIDVALEETTTVIVLNALDLVIHEASAELADGTVHSASVRLDAELERATLDFGRELGPGRVEVRLGFSGVLNDLLAGFYRATFTDAAGNEQVIATTQLGPADARRAFPCFDEPAFKSTFAVTVVVPEHLEAYSNSPVTAVTPLGGGRKEVVFSPTMRMSSYLVAVVVGPFARGEVVDVDGVPLSVVATPDKVHLGAFALEVGAHALRFYTDYFGMPYPGDKVDLVGIPDFAYGAMENLGCVTFREMRLLVDPSTASQGELQDVALVVAHELAHMWFGDLVTMEWWEGIWLNEAFATFLEYLCVDELRPEWRLWVLFNDEREAGLTADALHSTRAIEFEVHSPAEAMSMLDTITYRKGGAVLRMLEQYLGPDVYREGIRAYLREHAFANTSTTDLWRALESASGEPVGDVMETWIFQGGHPIVRSSEGTLTQAPFRFGPPTGTSAIGEAWRIPVRSRSLHGGATAAQLLVTSSGSLASDRPAVVNAGGSGVFRTSYGAAELEALIDGFSSLTEIERAVLLGDTWALARAGEQSLGSVLALARALGTAVEPSSWAIVRQVVQLLGLVAQDAHRAALESAARTLYAPMFDVLGWNPPEEEDERAPVVRASVIWGLGCVARDEDVRAEAARRFDNGALDGDLAGSVIAVVASMNRPGDHAEMRRRHADAQDPQEAARYREGLAQIADAGLAVETVAHCFEWFRVQDAPLLLSRLMANPVGGPAAWDAVTARWDEMLERIPPLMQFSLGVGVSSFVGDRALARRVAEFHLSHPIGSGQPTVDRAVEQMINGVEFAERVRPGLSETLGGARATSRAEVPR